MLSVRKGTTMRITDQDVIDTESILGLDELMLKLDGIPDDVSGATGRASHEIASLMRETAILRVPVDTGALKQSINTEIIPTAEGVDITLGTNLHYAPYVEFGTGTRGSDTGRTYGDHVADVDYSVEIRGQRAQPYIRPALYDNENNIRNILQREIDKELTE